MTNDDFFTDVWPSVLETLAKSIPQHKLDPLMDEYLTTVAKNAMDKKLQITRSKGRGGWWKPECSISDLKQMLVNHVDKGDMRDVMALAAMIYFKERETSLAKGSYN